MKKLPFILLVAFMMACFSQNLWAADVKDLLNESMKDVKAEKGSPSLLALTNATYVLVNGNSSEGYVDMIQEITGCSIGKKTLLFYHRPATSPLKILVYNKANSEAALISYDGSKAAKVNFKINGRDIITPDGWTRLQKAIVNPSDTFSLISIADAWAKGAPFSFLKCCEFHNHLCPGVSTGYQVVKFVINNYSLKKGESYAWIACPPWCKDDAVMVFLDLTPGKKTIFVKNLTAEQKKAIPGETANENIAGVLVIWNSSAAKGKAVALRYSWGEACRVSGIDRKDLSPQGGRSNPLFFINRVKFNSQLIPYLDKPKAFVKVVKEVEITPQMYTQMTLAGKNPYKVIGLAN